MAKKTKSELVTLASITPKDVARSESGYRRGYVQGYNACVDDRQAGHSLERCSAFVDELSQWRIRDREGMVPPPTIPSRKTESKPPVTTIQLWNIRFMLPEGQGARPVWCMLAPSVPAIGTMVTLVRDMGITSMDVMDHKPMHCEVFNVAYCIAAGHPPELQYYADVFVRPLP